MTRFWAHQVRGRLERLLRRPTSLAEQSLEQAVEKRLHRSSEPILIIEVGWWRCGSLPLLLGKIGYGVQVVRGLEAALDNLELMQPTLLIAGGMVNQNSYRVLRDASPAPILALIPEADAEQVMAAFAAGVDDCQVSPISNGEVVARVRAILRHLGRASPAAVESSS